MPTPSSKVATKAPSASTPCACTSGIRYGDCCAPYHRSVREAPDATALMRARYAAFALGLVDYLIHTLHPLHEDRQHSVEDLRRDVARALRRHKYMGLQVLESQGPDDAGVARVLFVAKVFERGADLSFMELSLFAHDGVGWRYRGGSMRDAPRGVVPSGTSIATFPPDEVLAADPPDSDAAVDVAGT